MTLTEIEKTWKGKYLGQELDLLSLIFWEVLDKSLNSGLKTQRAVLKRKRIQKYASSAFMAAVHHYQRPRHLPVWVLPSLLPCPRSPI